MKNSTRNPDDHSKIDLRFVTNPRLVVLYFIAKSEQLFELVKTNDFDSALILVEETLFNYKFYTAKKLPKAAIMNIRKAINSFEACWKLSSTICSIKAKKEKIQQLNLSEIKEHIETAYSSLAASKFICMILDQFSDIFMENHLMVAANSCIQLVMNAKIKKAKLYHQNVQISDTFSARIQDLAIQLEYMVQVFSFSNSLREDSSFEYEMRVRDNIFEDFLAKLNVQDLCNMPRIVTNNKEAQTHFDAILLKLSSYKELTGFLTSEEKDLMDLNYWMWFALAHHYMFFFEEEIEKYIPLLKVSSEVFDLILETFFSREQIRLYFVLEPQLEIQKHYKTLLEKNVMNYDMLMENAKIDVLNADPLDVGPMIIQLNIYNRNLIKVADAFLHFISWNEIVPEWHKGMILLMLGTALRTLIFDDKKEQKICLDQSIDYFKRLAKVTNSDEFKKIANTSGEALIGLNMEEHIALVDAGIFIQKFRRDVN